MATAAPGPGRTWGRLAIADLEDLHDAVLGAGLDVVQMSRAPVTGSLAFAHVDGVTYSSGRIDGTIELTGPLSDSLITVGVLLRSAPGTRHWLNAVDSRAVGVFMPGDEHQAFYLPGTLYATASLSLEKLEAIAADMDLVLDRRQLGGSGISERRMDARWTAPLLAGFERVHAGGGDLRAADREALGRGMLGRLVEHLARAPRLTLDASSARRHGRIVARARAHILEHLDEPLSIAGIARAAFTSQRTLHRAFVDVLGESPQSFVRTLRLNRIRHELADEPEARCTIALVANRWGISELGRLSGWYRELFGELPSQTLSRNQQAGAGGGRVA